MPVPAPATPDEEEEQLVEALTRSLELEPTAASAGDDVSAAASAAVSHQQEEPAQAAPEAAPQHGAVAAVDREAVDKPWVRFYVCWRLPLLPSVCGIVASTEPGAWPRFARVCLGATGVQGSGADFCGGRRTPSLLEAECVFLSRWRGTVRTQPLRYYLLE